MTRFAAAFSMVCLTVNLKVDAACLSKCNCSVETVMECSSVTVDTIIIPHAVKTVIIKDFNVTTLNDADFLKNPNWTRVDSLHISGEHGDTLKDRVFRGLHNLKALHFHHEQLTYLSRFSFQGLFLLETFDFSNTSKVRAHTVVRRVRSVHLPNLKTLILKRLGAYYPTAVDLTMEFFLSISEGGLRHVKHIDVSYVTIGRINYRYIQQLGLCDSLERIILRHCTIVSVVKIFGSEVCGSLKIIDLTGTFLPRMKYNLTKATVNVFSFVIGCFFNIEEYIFDNVLQKNLGLNLNFHGYGLTLSLCPIRIRRLSVKGNSLRWVNISKIVVSEKTTQSLEWTDASNNVIEYISPKLLAPSVNMKHLDLSHNKLHVMQQQYPLDFRALLERQEQLEMLGFNSNSLENLPRMMFKANSKLTHLDLSCNRLTGITFELDHMERLKLLNLSNNFIKRFNNGNRTLLERTASAAKEQLREFKVDLSGNPFPCTCVDEDIEFLKWLTETAVDFLVQKNETYSCMLGDQEFDVLNGGLQEMQDYCDWQRTKLYLHIFVPVTSVLFITAFILSAIRMNRFNKIKRMRDKINHVIRELQANRFPKQNLAFMSFCSEDDYIVTEKILPTLQRTLQTIVQTDQHLIAKGDAIFRPGFPITEEIVKGIDDAAVIIFAVSRNFCRKQWCQEELRQAYDQHKPIIMIMLEKVDIELMDGVLKRLFLRYTHARWLTDDTNGDHLEPDWITFCHSLITLAGLVLDGAPVANHNYGVDVH